MFWRKKMLIWDFNLFINFYDFISDNFFLTIIQTVFGVGLLVFGTPILIILGYDFYETLGILIPSSITISTFQLLKKNKSFYDEGKNIIYAVLGVFVGFTFLISFIETSLFIYLIFVCTVFASICRSNIKLNKILTILISNKRKEFHFINGVMHGFTNMGGILLPLYSNLIYVEKKLSTYNTAIFYFFYSIFQILIIFIFHNSTIFYEGLKYLPLTILVYFFLGVRTYRIINEKTFKILVVVFFWLLSISLALRILLI